MRIRNSAFQSESAKHNPARSGLPSRISDLIPAISRRQRSIHAVTCRQPGFNSGKKASPAKKAPKGAKKAKATSDGSRKNARRNASVHAEAGPGLKNHSSGQARVSPRRPRATFKASRLSVAPAPDRSHRSGPLPCRTNSIAMIKAARIKSASDTPRWKRPMAELNQGSNETESSRPESESVH